MQSIFRAVGEIVPFVSTHDWAYTELAPGMLLGNMSRVAAEWNTAGYYLAWLLAHPTAQRPNYHHMWVRFFRT